MIEHIKNTILGIDPGEKGAAVLIDIDTEKIIYMTDLSKEPEQQLQELLYKYGNPKHCFIEKVGSRRGNSAQAMFTFGENYGAIKAVLRLNKVDFNEVLPQKWQSWCGIYGANSATKNGTKLKAFELCKKVYGSGIFLGARGGLKDGRCDALLISLYGKHFAELSKHK
tara:strand:- start:18485 stop:18988 length:504 start_codon:yes stop_codon:yes gene_type:complete